MVCVQLFIGDIKQVNLFKSSVDSNGYLSIHFDTQNYQRQGSFCFEQPEGYLFLYTWDIWEYASLVSSTASKPAF